MNPAFNKLSISSFTMSEYFGFNRYCKYFEAGVHIKSPIKNSYQDGLGRTTQTLDHVVVVHILI
jgi:hypothetical protein